MFNSNYFTKHYNLYYSYNFINLFIILLPIYFYHGKINCLHRGLWCRLYTIYTVYNHDCGSVDHRVILDHSFFTLWCGYNAYHNIMYV